MMGKCIYLRKGETHKALSDALFEKSTLLLKGVA